MKNQKNSEILRVNPWKIILIFFGAFLVLEIIFFFSFQSTLSSLDESFFYYTPAILIATIIFCIISITQTSYQITDKKLIHNKMGKQDEYSWSSIIYINEEYSLAHKTISFYTNDGREHLLMFDKKGIIYNEMISKVNQISKEEFIRKFPNAKL